MSTSTSIWYVYGVVPSSSALRGETSPAGIDDATVTLERAGEAAALLSELSGPDYTPSAIETKSGDVEWLSPRAVAHDRVLTWASDYGAVIPLPMFSVFSGVEAVRAMLRERAGVLTPTLARVATGREYALRVYRVDAELLSAVPALSPRLRELASAATQAAPGQRYLLERKLDGERKTEMRTVTRDVVDAVAQELAAHALASVRSPIARADGLDDASRGTMVLNAAFLVAPPAMAEFQKTLTSLVERHAAHGFRFDFTGPWPPYHFVGESTESSESHDGG